MERVFKQKFHHTHKGFITQSPNNEAAASTRPLLLPKPRRARNLLRRSVQESHYSFKFELRVVWRIDSPRRIETVLVPGGRVVRHDERSRATGCPGSLLHSSRRRRATARHPRARARCRGARLFRRAARVDLRRVPRPAMASPWVVGRRSSSSSSRATAPRAGLRRSSVPVRRRSRGRRSLRVRSRRPRPEVSAALRCLRAFVRLPPRGRGLRPTAWRSRRRWERAPLRAVLTFPGCAPGRRKRNRSR